MKYDVFISYRTQDGLDAAESVFNYLQRNGYRCFFDNESIPRGHDYGKRIKTGVVNSRYFILILTQGYVDRCIDTVLKENWVREELKFALHPGLLKVAPRIIPLAMDDSGYRQMPQDVPLFTDKRVSHQQISFLPRNKMYFNSVMKDVVREALGGWQYRLFGRWVYRCKLLFISCVAALIMVLCATAFFVDDKCEMNVGLVGEKSCLDASTIVSKPLVPATNQIFIQKRGVVQARQELKELEKTLSHGEFCDIFHDFRRAVDGVTNAGKIPLISVDDASNQVEADIFNAVVVASSEARALVKAGMRSEEVGNLRPDLVLSVYDVRRRIEMKLHKLIESGRYEEALSYYTQAKRAFERCGFMDLERPNFEMSPVVEFGRE